MDQAFQRHLDACNSATLPGDRLRFYLAGSQVGWLKPAFADDLLALEAVSRCDDGVQLDDPSRLHAIARDLSTRGHYRFRNEAFDVRVRPGLPALATIDRGALPSFGIMAEGAHLNGLVRRDDGLHLWVARRASNKQLDPGKLDHLTAGGVSAGMSPWETLIKEAAEEAALPVVLAETSVHASTIEYAMDRAEGLRRDVLYCYDLALPESFIPRAADGEVESFELWPIARAFETVRDTDDFKFNVNLVLIDLFIRIGMIP